jgi:hypothetical protein
MKFRTRPSEVDAYQVQPVDGLTRLLPPPRAVDAIIKGDFRPLTDTAGTAVHTSKGAVRALVDDWIVRLPKGDFAVYSPSAFAAAFERVA